MCWFHYELCNLSPGSNTEGRHRQRGWERESYGASRPMDRYHIYLYKLLSNPQLTTHMEHVTRAVSPPVYSIKHSGAPRRTSTVQR